MAKITLAQVGELFRSDPQLRPLWELVSQGNDDDPAHDKEHLQRVALWTLRFVAGRVPAQWACAAALLHDFVNVPKNHPDRAKASEFSANEAAKLLPPLGYSAEAVREICDAIRDHSFSRGAKPERLLGQALQDADRLEAVGSLGLFRLISTGVRMGARYFHPQDPWAKKRALDDKSYSVDHCFVKLLKLPATMNLPEARAEGEKRAGAIRDFLRALGEELEEPAP